MSPVKTAACNFTFTAPAEAEPGTVGDLHCHRADGITSSFWEPSPEERAALAMGGLVAFQFFGNGHPVVALGVIRPDPTNYEVPKQELAEAVAVSCARAIETSGMHPSAVPAVIGSLIRGLAAHTGLPVDRVANFCRKAAIELSKATRKAARS